MISINTAIAEQAPAISKLVLASAEIVKSDCTVSGWELIKSLNNIEETEERIMDRDNLFLCAEVGNGIVGIIVIKNNEKLDQLFIDPNYFKQGLAKTLWLEAKTRILQGNDSATVWVRSSSMAVPVYLSFGFTKIGSIQQVNGISFQQMEISFGK